MSQKQQKRPPWRDPVIVSALAVPIVGALLVTTVTLLILSIAGTVHLSWSGAWAIVFSVLISAVVLFIVFVLGGLYSLRVMFRLLGEVLEDVFQAFPKAGQSSGANVLDTLLLSLARSVMPPGATQSRQGAAAATKGVVVDAVPPSSPGQEPPKEPPGDAEPPPAI